jgi:hypothetical protein
MEGTKEQAIKLIQEYRQVSYSIARHIYSMQSIKQKQNWRIRAAMESKRDKPPYPKTTP